MYLALKMNIQIAKNMYIGEVSVKEKLSNEHVFLIQMYSNQFISFKLVNSVVNFCV